ncbi:uncharacterized protein Dsimw501_GD28773 [Drosophila simulans]|nr:uncharacterized protein Dsimw501_GD28773 [Drosophila simulans]
MLHSSYNRAPRRKLIPNLFSNILQVIADADHPLTEPEIMEAVADRLDPFDEELKRQITVSLHDALIYGYLRVKNYRYSIVPSRLDPDEHRDHNEPSSSITAAPEHNRLQERISSGTSAAMDDNQGRDEELTPKSTQPLKRVNAEPQGQTN